MTCLFNARAYRDGSAAALRRPDTSYWVLGCRGLVREHLVPHVQGEGLPRRGTTCQGVPTAIAPLKDLESFCNQHIFLVRPRGRGWVRGWVRGGAGGGSSPAAWGSNWRLRTDIVDNAHCVSGRLSTPCFAVERGCERGIKSLPLLVREAAPHGRCIFAVGEEGACSDGLPHGISCRGGRRAASRTLPSRGSWRCRGLWPCSPSRH
jgi:hypothetical protein